MAKVTVKINGAASSEFVRTPDGPIGRYLMVIGEQVKTTTIASLSAHPPGGWPRVFLGPTIVKRGMNSGDGYVVRVGTDKVKTKPHIIGDPGRPANGKPLLRFKWPKGAAAGAPGGPDANGYFHFALVHHPGSDFTKYLSRKLAEATELVIGRLK